MQQTSKLVLTKLHHVKDLLPAFVKTNFLQNTKGKVKITMFGFQKEYNLCLFARKNISTFQSLVLGICSTTSIHSKLYYTISFHEVYSSD